MRKDIARLTPEDLRAHPVWEFLLNLDLTNNQDEALVEPFVLSEPLNPGLGMFVVRTRFTLACGAEHTGFCTPVPECEAAIPLTRPTIVTAKGHVPFWLDTPATGRHDAARLLECLDRDLEAVFPVQFACKVPMQGGPMIGAIQGFMSFVDGRECVVYPPGNTSSSRYK